MKRTAVWRAQSPQVVVSGAVSLQSKGSQRVPQRRRTTDLIKRLVYQPRRRQSHIQIGHDAKATPLTREGYSISVKPRRHAVKPVETEAEKQARVEANRAMMQQLAASGAQQRPSRRNEAASSSRIQPRSPLGNARDDTNRDRLEEYHQRETERHRQESEAQRKIREEAKRAKAN